jgi:ribosomal protein S12 methylthiotransferase accessory factor
MLLDLEGTIRAKNPQETLNKLKPLLPLFGITRVASVEGLTGIKVPVSVAVRPNSRILSTSQGKGISRELADISAIMESIEVYHAERLPPCDKLESIANLKRENISFIHPDELNLYYNLTFSEEEPIEWMKVQRFMGNGEALVPRAYLSLNSAEQFDCHSSSCFRGDSNGLASGNTQLEAIAHALFEVIERHCVYDFIRQNPNEYLKLFSEVDQASITGAPHIAKLMQLIEESQLELRIRAMHGPIGVPVFGAQLQDLEPTRRTFVAGGFGAHPIPEVALSRAITEAIQSRVTVITGSRDDIFPWHFLSHDLAFVKFNNSFPKTNFKKVLWNEVPRAPRFSDFTEMLKWTLQQLSHIGKNEVYFYNYQKPEFGDIPVVKVIVPGMKISMDTMRGE